MSNLILCTLHINFFYYKIGFKEVNKAKTKFANLRRQYKQAKDCYKLAASGSASKHKKQWRFFNEMSFLDEVGDQ